MINLNELQAFVHVAKHQSFTSAGHDLDLPKSSVSRAIARLEKRLGVRLIARTTRSVVLTEAGQVYLERCQRVMEEAQDAEHSISAIQDTPRGHLRVGAPIAFAQFLAGALPEFLSQYPEIRLSLLISGVGTSPAASNADVLIRPGPLEDSDLLVKTLFQIRLGLYASPDYLAKRRLPKKPSDLKEHSCVSSQCITPGRPADVAVWRLRDRKGTQHVQLQPRIALPDPSLAHQLALGGAGIAIVSQPRALQDVRAKRLVRILPDWEPEPVVLHALYGARLSTAPKVRAFLEFVQNKFAVA